MGDTSPSSQCMELEEIHETLERERALVLSAQENYKNLKTKFLELTQQTNIQLDELQTKLSERERQIDALIEMSDAYKTDNDLLQEQMRQLSTSLEDATRTAKAKENEMRREFSDQIERLLESTSKDDSDDLAVKYDATRQKELSVHDAKVKELLSEIRDTQCAMDERVQSLKSELREERQRRVEVETVAHRCRADLDTARKLAVAKQNELISVRSELNRRLKEAMESEMTWITKEENFRRTLMERTSSFEKQIAECQRVLAEKDDLISDLRHELQQLRSLHSTAITESSLRSGEEEKRRLESELQQLSLASKQNEARYLAVIEELKQERNKLEITVAELKKNSEVNPSMAAEISRLRGIVREKEEKLHVSRRRYEQLLRKVESSLFHLEKQHRQTKKKLEENIIGSY